MAIFRNKNITGKFEKKEGFWVFKGIDTTNNEVEIRLLANNETEGKRIATDKDLEDALKESIKNTYTHYIEKNKNLSDKEKIELKKEMDNVIKSALEGESVSLNFASLNGIYKKDKDNKKVLTAVASITPVETDNGIFYPVKINDTKNLYKNYSPVRISAISKKEKRPITFEDIKENRVDPDDIRFYISPIQSMWDEKDIDYLFEMNKNNIEYNEKVIKEKGKTPFFQNKNEKENNFYPPLQVFLPKSIVRSLASESEVVAKVFEKASKDFYIPLIIDDKEVKINKENFHNFEKNKKIMEVCQKYILSKLDNSYEKLFKFINKDEETIEKAKKIDKFNSVIQKMNSTKNIKTYLEESEKLKNLIKEYGLKNSPVGIKYPVSLIDSKKKYENDKKYKQEFHKAIKKILNDFLKEVEKEIKIQGRIYQNLPGEYAEIIRQQMNDRVEFVTENNRIKDINYKKDAKGNTLLGSMPLIIEAQIPIKRSNEYPPSFYKLLINNRETIDGFSGRDFGIDGDKMKNLLGIPTIVSKNSNKEQIIEINVDNDKNSELVVESNKDIKENIDVKEEKKEEKKEQVKKEQPSLIVFDADEEVSIAPEEINKMSKTEKLVEAAKVEEIEIEVAEIEELLKSSTPSAEKAEQIENKKEIEGVTIPSI